MKKEITLTLINESTILTSKQEEIINSHIDIIEEMNCSIALNDEGQVCVLLEDSYIIITEKLVNPNHN